MACCYYILSEQLTGRFTDLLNWNFLYGDLNRRVALKKDGAPNKALQHVHSDCFSLCTTVTHNPFSKAILSGVSSLAASLRSRQKTTYIIQTNGDIKSSEQAVKNAGPNFQQSSV